MNVKDWHSWAPTIKKNFFKFQVFCNLALCEEQTKNAGSLGKRACGDISA